MSFPRLKAAFSLATLSGALLLSGCAESPADKAAKPEAIDAVTVFSTNDTRLRTALAEVDTHDLRILAAYNVSVTLDTRLSQQDKGFFDKRILGTLYNTPDENGGRVLALWDDGKPAQFGSLDAFDYAERIIEITAKKLKNGDIQPDGENWYAARYSAGKSTVTRMRPERRFDQDTLDKNPQLQQRPEHTRTKTPERTRAPSFR